jgi:hypothetical protein
VCQLLRGARSGGGGGGGGGVVVVRRYTVQKAEALNKQAASGALGTGRDASGSTEAKNPAAEPAPKAEGAAAGPEKDVESAKPKSLDVR